VRLAAAALAGILGYPAPADYQEQVRAERVIVDAHVLDFAGRPVRGLSRTDFAVRVDGRNVELESAEWIDVASPNVPPVEVAAGAVPWAAVDSGRLLVLFFQADFEMSRIVGQMRMIRQAERFLATCGESDRLAVLSYDSRLKLRQDFTGDRSKLRRAIRRTLYADDPPDPAPGPEPSIARRFDFAAARRASLPEHALRVLGDALAGLPGAKSLLFFGWGLGNFDPGFGLLLDHNFEPARRALVRARTAVFSLDVTSADFHSLQGGLEAMSEGTGGFYVKTHVFPQLAMESVERAVEGEYELVFVRPNLPRGLHRVEVRVPRRRAAVLARPTYDD
jgi:VWFA-related protein